ncbi:MAG: lipid II:glycine glycyltransferase FemX [Thiotrichales bacterium]
MSKSRTPAEWALLWNQYLTARADETGFMQSTWWTDLMVRQGARQIDAFYLADARIHAGAKVLIYEYQSGFCYFYTPDGPLFSADPEAAQQEFDALIDRLDRYRAAHPHQHFSHLRIEHKWSAYPGFVDRLRPADDWLEPRTTIFVDVSGTPEEILARMRPTGRRWIRKAIASGVNIVVDCSEPGIDAFIALYTATMERKAQYAMDRGVLTDLAQTLFANDCGTLYFAEQDGKRIATAMIVFFANRATYLFAGSDAQSRGTMAPYLLNYQVMCDANARGLDWYDLYGGVPAEMTQHTLAGISIFKHNLGGRDADFGPALDYVYDEWAYDAYQRFVRERYRVAVAEEFVAV